MASKPVKRGLTLSPASWNTIWMRARSCRVRKRAHGLSDNSRSPSLMLPSLTSTSRVSARTKVDLPQPDSPTRPTVSPLLIDEAHIVDRIDFGQGLHPAGEAPFQPRPGAGAAADRKQLRDVGNVEKGGHAALTLCVMMLGAVTRWSGSGFRAGDDMVGAGRHVAATAARRPRSCADSVPNSGRAAGRRGADRAASREWKRARRGLPPNPASRRSTRPYRDAADARTVPRSAHSRPRGRHASRQCAPNAGRPAPDRG